LVLEAVGNGKKTKGEEDLLGCPGQEVLGSMVIGSMEELLYFTYL